MDNNLNGHTLRKRLSHTAAGPGANLAFGSAERQGMLNRPSTDPPVKTGPRQNCVIHQSKRLRNLTAGATMWSNWKLRRPHGILDQQTLSALEVNSPLRHLDVTIRCVQRADLVHDI